MEIARLALSYIQTLIWPLFIAFVSIRYQEFIESLMSRSKITLNIAGQKIETSLEVLQRSIEASSFGPLTPEQSNWLTRLRDEGRAGRQVPYKEADYQESLLPLRNAALIRAYPGRPFLHTATHVEITPLGKLLVEALELDKNR